jgi:predicted naringenin-chalcone synthase
MLIFGDGCAAALVTGDDEGLALQDFRAATIDDSADAITWRIGDQGFDMHLSGEVPGKIQRALAHEASRNDKGGLMRGTRADDYALWAVHAGGRTILDAVEAGLELGGDALGGSRAVLKDCGNMSSATLMFVLQRMLKSVADGEAPRGAPGMAMAFGPGLAAESFRFTTV